MLPQKDAAVTVDVGGHRLEGKATDDRDGRGVAAMVEVAEEESGRVVAATQANSLGGFAIDGLAAGRYRLRLRAEGYLPTLLSAVLVPREGPLGPLAMQRGEEATVRIVLRRADSHPLGKAAVALLDEEGRALAARHTDLEGGVDLPVLARQKWWVAWQDGFSGVGIAGPYEAAAGVRTLTPPLEHGGTVRLRCPVPRCTGLPVQELTVVHAEGVDLTAWMSGVTPHLVFGEDAALTLGRLAAGVWTFQVQLAGSTYRATATVKAGETTEVRF